MPAAPAGASRDDGVIPRVPFGHPGLLAFAPPGRFLALAASGRGEGALVLIRINMATYSSCYPRDSRLPFHPGEMNGYAEKKPIWHQFVAARKADPGGSGAEIYVAILYRPSCSDDPPGCRGFVQ
jgi:hypothetical protein